MIYKIKNEITEEQLTQAGFLMEETEDNEKYYYCFVSQDLNGELAQGSLKGIYSNPDWIKNFYEPHKDIIADVLGLKYSKKGKPIMSKQFINTLTRWRVEFNFEEKMLYLKSLDPWDAVGYSNTEVIDKFCGKLVMELNDLNLIDKVEG